LAGSRRFVRARLCLLVVPLAVFDCKRFGSMNTLAQYLEQIVDPIVRVHAIDDPVAKARYPLF
jgi:hypothetical protein